MNERIDPLSKIQERLTQRAEGIRPVAATAGRSEEMVKVTVQLPLRLYSELSKIAIDHRLSKKTLFTAILSHIRDNPELLDKILGH